MKPKEQALAEPEEIPILSLAPFTSIPKISFDNILIGQNVSKTLIIENPTSKDVTVYIICQD